MDQWLFAQAGGPDVIDLVLQAGIVGTFIIFGVALLFIKINRGKSPPKSDDQSPPK